MTRVLLLTEHLQGYVIAAPTQGAVGNDCTSGQTKTLLEHSTYAAMCECLDCIIFSLLLENFADLVMTGRKELMSIVARKERGWYTDI